MPASPATRSRNGNGRWWPGRGDSPDAVAGCEVCPARAECLAYALAADERDGI
ncbi:MAG: WhiB family transcriptional regulator [Actinomycetota bacterium]|nr:WhiB family transcriptional regulator [Actinomycetota bacterium]